MSHHVIPDNFPASPDLGDTHTYHGGVWTYTNLGWVKTEIVLTSDHPIYTGLMVDTTP